MSEEKNDIGEIEAIGADKMKYITLLLLTEKYSLKKVFDQDDLNRLMNESESMFLSAIVGKRVLAIDAKFTEEAIILTSVVCDRPGSAVIYLIDVLNALGKGTDDKPITVSDICKNLYPKGFRSTKSYEKTVDEIKSKGKKHSEYAYLY